jgi:hypothetical protein
MDTHRKVILFPQKQKTGERQMKETNAELYFDLEVETMLSHDPTDEANHSEPYSSVYTYNEEADMACCQRVDELFAKYSRQLEQIKANARDGR